MAKRTVIISDLDGKPVEDADLATVSVTIGTNVYVVDASKDDKLIQTLVTKGTKQNKRGRKTS